MIERSYQQKLGLIEAFDQKQVQSHNNKGSVPLNNDSKCNQSEPQVLINTHTRALLRSSVLLRLVSVASTEYSPLHHLAL